MKKFFILAHILLLTATLAVAQPSWTKKASKSVFTLKTFQADGTLIGSSNGFFTGEKGEGVSSFAPFKGASRAVIIDAQGKEMEVECLLGANETYDVAKFRVASKKTVPLTCADSQAAIGSSVWLLPYRETRTVGQGTVRKAETFNSDQAYYTIALTMPENTVGCPLLNEAGEVIGLMQQPNKLADTLSYAVSARFANTLSINGLSINDQVLRSTHIKKDLPDDVNQAILTLYMAEASVDSTAYTVLIDDFINKFPNQPDGYVYRAQQEANSQMFDAATKDMEQAIKVAEKKDEIHFNFSKLIYNKEVYMPNAKYDGWSLDKAMEEAKEAQRINPALPIYRHQQALILYAQQKYDEAYQVYTTLFDSDIRSANLFYEASRCKFILKDTTAVLALLDSCMAMYEKPYLKEAGPYLLARAQARLDAGKYREAAIDFNEYETLMPNGLTDNFYYVRHQANVGGRLYQQALNDINKAIELSPQTDLYYAEKASLQIRVGLIDDALVTARELMQVAPQSSDGYLFLGLAQCLKGQKAEGIKNLQRAKEMGDEQADDLIEKYK